MKAAYTIWKSQLDKLCKAQFGIDTHEMGSEDNQLKRYWSDGETPQEITDYFGTKYNLTRIAEINWGKPLG